jgi:hypothetical protein
MGGAYCLSGKLLSSPPSLSVKAGEGQEKVPIRTSLR